MISLIAALGQNGEIGEKGQLIWHLKKDMVYFKKTTLNHKVIMGYNTYKSIGQALPNRVNIVLTKNPNKIKEKEVIVVSDAHHLLEEIKDSKEEYFIIGGSSIYNLFLPYANKLYLTLIKDTYQKADCYFPKINKNEWQETVLEENTEDNLEFTFVILERIKK